MEPVWFYLIAILPLAVALAAAGLSRRIVWWHAAFLVVPAFAVAGMMHGMAIASMTSDTEIRSGQITSARKIPEWTEAYDKEIYRTVQKTLRVSYEDNVGTADKPRYVTKYRTEVYYEEEFSHLEARTRFHAQSFSKHDSFGRSWSIPESEYLMITERFGKTETKRGDRTTWGYRERNSRLLRGDPNDYEAVNVTGWIFPTTMVTTWTNKVKASPSLFSYAEPPESIRADLAPYPSVADPFQSDRLMGAPSWPILAWDQMNARLGPTKKVNLSVVHFVDKDPSYGRWQEALWIGGKKNDVVITVGSSKGAITWCHVFGWTDQTIAKVRIRDAVLAGGFTAPTLHHIEQIVRDDYIIKDWSAFDYLTPEIPGSYFAWFATICLIMTAIWTVVILVVNQDDAPRTSSSWAASIRRRYHPHE